jgi:hypothetical protein
MPGRCDPAKARSLACASWKHAVRMRKMIQIRNVPDEVHRELRIPGVAAQVQVVANGT